MQISIIADDLVATDKSGYLGNVSGFVTVKDLEMFAKICLKYHICCGLFFNNKRNLEDFREIWFLQFDFDTGVTPEEVIKKIGKSVNMVVMASKNHMKDKHDGKGAIPRFHVFLPLQKSIVEPEFYHFCVKYLAKKWNVPIDPQATDSTRYMFKHSNCLYIQNGGWNFDVEGVIKLKWKIELEEQEKENQKKTEWLKKDNANFNISFADRMVAAKKLIKEYVGDSVSGMGGDITTFKAMCYGVKCGLIDTSLKEFADWYNDNFCNPKWTNRALLHKIKCAKKRVQSGDMLSARYIMKLIGKQDYMQNFT